MSDVITRLVAKFESDTSGFDAGVQKVNAGVNGVQKSTSSKIGATGKAFTMAGAALTTGFGGPLLFAIKTGMSFDETMSRVRAKADMTGKEFAKIRDLAIDLGAKTSFSAKQAAEGMEMLAAAGMKPQEIMKTMPALLNAAAASGEELGAVSEILVETMGGFALAAKDAGHVTDVLAHVANATTASIGDVGEAMKYVAPLAKTAGYNIDQVGAMMLVMAKSGVKGSQAGTTLRGAFSRLAGPTTKARAAMKDLGIAYADANGAMLPGAKVLENISVRFKTMSREQKLAFAKTVFGTEAMTGMIAVLNEGTRGMKKYTKEVRNSNGEAKTAAQIMRDNFSASLESLQGSLESVGIMLSDNLKGPLRALAGWIQSGVDAFGKMNPKIQKAVAIFMAIGAALGGLMLVLGPIMMAWPALAAAIGAISLPVVAVIAAIIGLAAALVLAWRNSSAFRSMVKETFSEIGETVAVVVAFITKAWKKLMPPIIAWMKKHGADLFRVIMIPLRMIITQFRVGMALLRGDWRQAWTLIRNFLSSTVRALWNTAKALGALLGSAMKSAGRKAGSGLKAGVAALPGVMHSIVSRVVSAAQGLVSRLWSVGASAGRALGNALKGAVNSVLSRIRSFSLPTIKIAGKKIPGTGGHPFGGIPSLAQGGIITKPTIARIGEAGPEAVVPLRRAGSASAMLAGAGGGGGGLVVNGPLVSVAGTRASAEDVGRAVVSALRKAGIRP